MQQEAIIVPPTSTTNSKQTQTPPIPNLEHHSENDVEFVVQDDE